MRGQLRIHSQRSPYLRAGLSWPTREAVEVAIVDLDGERFLELIRDPVLRIEMSDDAGVWRPVPIISDDLSAANLQVLVDTMRDAQPPVEDQVLHLDPAAIATRCDELQQQLDTLNAKIVADADELRADGFSSIAELIHAWGGQATRATEMGLQLDASKAEVIKLQAQLAAAAKPATPKTSKPKPVPKPAEV